MAPCWATSTNGDATHRSYFEEVESGPHPPSTGPGGTRNRDGRTTICFGLWRPSSSVSLNASTIIRIRCGVSVKLRLWKKNIIIYVCIFMRIKKRRER